MFVFEVFVSGLGVRGEVVGFRVGFRLKVCFRGLVKYEG